MIILASVGLAKIAELLHEYIYSLFFDRWALSPVDASMKACATAEKTAEFVTEALLLQTYFDNINNYVLYNARNGHMDTRLMGLAARNANISEACLKKYWSDIAQDLHLHFRAAWLDTYGLALYRSAVGRRDFAKSSESRARLAKARDIVLDALQVIERIARRRDPPKAVRLSNLSNVFETDTPAATRSLFQEHLELIEAALKQTE